MSALHGNNRTIGRRPVLWRVRLAALVGAVALVVPLTVLGDAMSASAATTYTVTATVPVGSRPAAVAVNAATNTVYVANYLGNTVSVITPATVPGVPSGVSVTAGNGQATVVFTPPASDGGSAITGYTVTATDSTTPANGGQTVSGTDSPIVVTGLTNGDSYTFTVTATNTVGTGTGAASATSSPATPTTPVSTPADPSLAATGPDQALPMGLAGLLLITGLAVLGAARLRSRSGDQHLDE